MSEQGITVIQELAFILCERIEVIDAALARGVPFDRVGPEIPLEFACEIDFFETICKIRAARRMWAKIAKERYHASDVRGMTAPTSVQLAGSSMIRRQPIFNIIRETIEALAGVFAGVQGMQLIGFDEPLALISYDGGLINAGIESIIAHETGIPLVVDPLGGSYYVEWLTKKIEDEARAVMHRIEEAGGYINAIQTGFLQAEIKKSIIERQKRMDKRQIIKVCENDFLELGEEEIPTRYLDYNYESQKENIASIMAEFEGFKRRRDIEKVKEALLNVRAVAQQGGNVIGPIKEAYKADATIGETLGVLNEAMGHGYDPFGMIERPSFLDY